MRKGRKKEEGEGEEERGEGEEKEKKGGRGMHLSRCLQRAFVKHKSSIEESPDPALVLHTDLSMLASLATVQNSLLENFH